MAAAGRRRRRRRRERVGGPAAGGGSATGAAEVAGADAGGGGDRYARPLRVAWACPPFTIHGDSIRQPFGSGRFHWRQRAPLPLTTHAPPGGGADGGHLARLAASLRAHVLGEGETRGHGAPRRAPAAPGHSFTTPAAPPDAAPGRRCRHRGHRWRSTSSAQVTREVSAEEARGAGRPECAGRFHLGTGPH
jgi:hypothetical protein